MADYGHEETDKRLEALEKRVAAVYKQASEEMKQKLAQWYKDFERLDKQKAALVDAGKLPKADYLAWRKGKMVESGRLKALVDTLTADYVNSDKIAMQIVRGDLTDVYALNANYAAYKIEQDAGVDLSWTLYDHSTVERMIREDPDVLPLPSVDIPLDERWNRQHLNNAITQGILQGESIPHIADRLQRILGMDHTAAVRSARTATTAAESSGRIDAFKYAESLGIHLKQMWRATLDGKTRHAHRLLDGQMVDVGEPFQVDGYEIRFPGDPSAPGYLIYNCRCAVVSVDKFHDQKAPRVAENPLTGKAEVIQGMTYTEWEEKHKAENPEAWELYQKKSQNLASDKKQYAEFKDVLGGSAPKSLDAFQSIKYNDPERWAELKVQKRQTRFVNNAPCETTPKKFSGYFLKPEAKHSSDFFGVGYTQDNPLQLRYDIAKQYDESKAFKRTTRSDDAETFNMYMELGVSKERTFLTGWIKDKPDSKPRIVTAFRKNRSENDDK